MMAGFRILAKLKGLRGTLLDPFGHTAERRLERQLRRLCRQHLGASPIAVAQTRRVLLAKQLIHETSLPMAEIARPCWREHIRNRPGG